MKRINCSDINHGTSNILNVPMATVRNRMGKYCNPFVNTLSAQYKLCLVITFIKNVFYVVDYFARV